MGSSTGSQIPTSLIEKLTELFAASLDGAAFAVVRNWHPARRDPADHAAVEHVDVTGDRNSMTAPPFEMSTLVVL
jgi:hypothetical protein